MMQRKKLRSKAPMFKVEVAAETTMFSELELLPQRRDLNQMMTFIREYEEHLERKKTEQMAPLNRLKYSVSGQSPQRKWTRGTRVVHNQTTELNLRLNELTGLKCERIPELVRMLLEVPEDAVHVMLEKVWNKHCNIKALAHICHKAFQSHEYGGAAQLFQNGITREVKFSFYTLQFDVPYQELELWTHRVIRTSEFIGTMFINGTYSACFLDECISYCMERILECSDIPRKTKRDQWLQSWFLALTSLMQTVGRKLDTQQRDEKVFETIRDFMERVHQGLVAQIRASNQLLFQFFDMVAETVDLPFQVMEMINFVQRLRETSWQKNIQLHTPTAQ